MSALAYDDFLQAKVHFDDADGFEIADADIHPILLEHQRLLVRWGVARGRGAFFAAFGLGKSVIQLETVRLILKCSGKARGLIVVPLAVRQEMRRDAKLIDLDVTFVRSNADITGPGIYLTNYESVRLGKVDVTQFDVVSLDEAAVLRSLSSKQTQALLTQIRDVRYRYLATATPSPNRYIELVNYADWLGVMDRGQALAQPLDAKILTPGGWRSMGDINVGDEVIAVDGEPTEVLGVYPQGAKDIYRVTFSDGTSTECTGEHLWLTRTAYQRTASRKFSGRNPEADAGHYWTTKTTDQIAETLRVPSTDGINHEIPMVAPVQFTKRDVAVDPWLMGLLLGDGCLRPTGVTLTTMDEWIVKEAERIVAPLGMVLTPGAVSGLARTYYITGGPTARTGRGHRSNAVLNGFRDYGLLCKRAWEKSIPTDFLLNDSDTRLAVLQGLMDSDGSIATDVFNRTPRLTTSSPQLAADVEFIVGSLGGTTHTTQRIGTKPDGNPGRLQYRVTIRLPNGINPFRLPRKASLVVDRSWYPPKKFVKAVELVDNREAQCIAVAHPERLYVTDDFIVTHNTRWFQRDTTHAGNLTLHPLHSEAFHLWLSTWAVFLQKPSDLGCSDEGYELPPIEVVWHEVEVDHSEHISADRDGQSRMFRGAELGVSDASREKRMTLDVRVAKMAELVNESPDDHFILWHHLEDERKAIRKALPETTEVFGALDLDEQERRVIAFADGETRLLATKPSINGAGCNLQRHCHRAIYVGVDFDFHLFIQSVHRIQRFQQTHPVRIDIIYAESEREVVRTLRRKWKEHEELTANMSALIKEHGLSREAIDKALTRSIGTERIAASGDGWTAVLNDCVYELSDRMADNSIDMHLTSIPFGNHYQYSASVNDLGYTDNNDHFWQQMDYITPNLLRTLKPGRVYACHVKDRMLYGNMTGAGCQTSSPFHAEAIMHNIKHGFLYLGMITIVTDVVAENNQTYRLTQKEMRKDGTKMGVGSPEYVLLFRKQQSDLSNEYADEPVVHTKANYSLARWQTDAHGFWRSGGDRYLTPDELAELPADQVYGLWRKYSRDNIYDYDVHLQIGEALEGRGSLPSKFMLLAPESNHPDVWTDIDRLHTLNGEQSKRNLENHICPFNFSTVDRLIERYSNKGDLIFDPFGGLSTVAVRAMILGRRGYTVELNPSSWRDGVNYCAMTERKVSAPTLFDLAELDAAS